MTPQPERNGPGRRQVDQDCAAHEDRMDSIERKLAWQKGRDYIIGGGLSLALVVTGWLANATYTKVSSIEDMLNKGTVASSVLATKLEGLDIRVKAIEERHIFESQHEVRK